MHALSVSDIATNIRFWGEQGTPPVVSRKQQHNNWKLICLCVPVFKPLKIDSNADKNELCSGEMIGNVKNVFVENSEVLGW